MVKTLLDYPWGSFKVNNKLKNYRNEDPLDLAKVVSALFISISDTLLLKTLGHDTCVTLIKDAREPAGAANSQKNAMKLPSRSCVITHTTDWVYSCLPRVLLYLLLPLDCVHPE